MSSRHQVFCRELFDVPHASAPDRVACSGKGASPDDTFKHIGVFSDVVAHIKSEYVEEPDMKSVTLGALNGLLEAIDPFASYLNAEQYQRIPEEQGRRSAPTSA